MSTGNWDYIEPLFERSVAEMMAEWEEVVHGKLVKFTSLSVGQQKRLMEVYHCPRFRSSSVQEGVLISYGFITPSENGHLVKISERGHRVVAAHYGEIVR